MDTSHAHVWDRISKGKLNVQETTNSSKAGSPNKLPDSLHNSRCEIIWTSTNYIASICVMVSKIISNKYDIWKTNTVIFLTCNSAQQKYVDTRFLKQMCKRDSVIPCVKAVSKTTNINLETSIWKTSWKISVKHQLFPTFHIFSLSFHCLFTRIPATQFPGSPFSQGSSSTKFSSKAFNNAEAPRSEISLLLRSKEKSKDWLRSTFRRFHGSRDVKGIPGDPRG